LASLKCVLLPYEGGLFAQQQGWASAEAKIQELSVTEQLINDRSVVRPDQLYEQHRREPSQPDRERPWAVRYTLRLGWTGDKDFTMNFFSRSYSEIVEAPNGVRPWWHSVPLPDGRRIKGAHPDIDRQFKMWEAMQIDAEFLARPKQRVLDIGANDGFFSVASAKSGASVTSIDTTNWLTWPHNITYLSQQWSAQLDVVTYDFRRYCFDQQFDVIFFLGVLYHVENVFECMARLKNLLAPQGTIYLETHLTSIAVDMPIWESASDLFSTSAPLGKSTIGQIGISNFLLPNVQAVINLAHIFDMKCEPLLDNAYCLEDPGRGMFRITQ